jgi:TolA-binding protein
MCEIDSVLLKGKAAPVPVFALIARLDAVTSEQRATVTRYEQALAALRRGDRDIAEQAFREVANSGHSLADAAARMLGVIAARGVRPA